MAVEDLEFKQFCVDQTDRLGVFETYRFMSVSAQKEYRKFFEKRTRDRSKIERAMDEVVMFEAFPTLTDMAQLWNRMYGESSATPMSEDEHRARAEYTKKLYEENRRGAEERRTAFLAKQRENKSNAINHAAVPTQITEALK